MELSVREARAQFATALAAAERGERVTITKNGKPVAEIGPPQVRKGGIDWTKAAQTRARLGIKPPAYPLDEEWRRAFDDPAFSREALGLDDDWEPYRG
ncbi:type II toxin-antitoxin system prevent-host-death family antitoxin [Sphingomonas sp. SUN019]|uniref:type II toxin-antitoxin system Phd/YefM family antitoxin n=1 Tax=Sphingomonas sp. SUN019 TaxID=2937788 RepID=UPI00216429CD|nr:type II toxin-antitoxin system prevent-host-death family antitoxin [Sphingomonas sp. SUN019]UVO51609.1 type II toxin-antitoxin system prevent-host-death family antitoxin [Sphingomonas sp. SUN019]